MKNETLPPAALILAPNKQMQHKDVEQVNRTNVNKLSHLMKRRRRT